MVGSTVNREPVSDLNTGLLSAMWRHRVIVLLSALVGALLAMLVVVAVPARYEASAELVVQDPRDTSVFRDLGPRDSARGLRNHLQALTGDESLERAALAAGLDMTRSQLRRAVEVRVTEDDVVTIETVAGDPQRAAAFANALGDGLQDRLRDEVSGYAEAARLEILALRDQLQATIAETEAILATTTDEVSRATLERRRFLALEDMLRAERTAEEFRIDAALYGTGVSRFSPATAPSRPQNPGPLYAGLLGALVGLTFGSLLAWYRSERNPRILRPTDAEPILGLRLLGSIGPSRTVGSAQPPTRSAREAVGALSFGLHDTSVLLLTAAEPGPAAAYTALQLAIATSSEGLQVAVVDCNPDDPVEPLLTGRKTPARLTDITTPGGDLMAAMYSAPSSAGPPIEVLGLSSLPPQSMRSVLGSAELHRALSKLVDDGYQVLVHGPPMSAGTVAAILAGLVEGIVVTVQRGTSVWTILECRRRLEASQAPGLGYVYAAPVGESRVSAKLRLGAMPRVRPLRPSAR